MAHPFINTTLGPMLEHELNYMAKKKEHIIDDDNEITKITEYWLEGVQIHRSVHVHLKKGLFAGLETG